MAVIKYIPKKKEIIDKRTDDGGYYEAECNVCGTMFYPTRANAKYCSRSCQVMAFRTGQTKKEVKNTPNEEKTDVLIQPTGIVDTFLGLDAIINHLRSRYPEEMKNKVGYYRELFNKLITKKNYVPFADFKIIRISERKLAIYRG